MYVHYDHIEHSIIIYTYIFIHTHLSGTVGCKKKLTFRNCNYDGITNYSTVKLRRRILVITQKLRTTNWYLRIVITDHNYVHTTYMQI